MSRIQDFGIMESLRTSCSKELRVLAAGLVSPPSAVIILLKGWVTPGAVTICLPAFLPFTCLSLHINHTQLLLCTGTQERIWGQCIQCTWVLQITSRGGFVLRHRSGFRLLKKPIQRWKYRKTEANMLLCSNKLAAREFSSFLSFYLQNSFLVTFWC